MLDYKLICGRSRITLFLSLFSSETLNSYLTKTIKTKTLPRLKFAGHSFRSICELNAALHSDHFSFLFITSWWDSIIRWSLYLVCLETFNVYFGQYIVLKPAQVFCCEPSAQRTKYQIHTDNSDLGVSSHTWWYWVSRVFLQRRQPQTHCATPLVFLPCVPVFCVPGVILTLWTWHTFSSKISFVWEQSEKVALR